VIRISAPDARSVLIETRTPTSVLGYALTGVFIARASASPAGFVGTGPYRVAAFEPGERRELERFPEANGPRPFLARVVFEPAAEGSRVALADPGGPATAILRRGSPSFPTTQAPTTTEPR